MLYNFYNPWQTYICVPSLIEGWGQYIDEGRRAKSIVVTLNAPPMNELIQNDKTGILVKASKGPSMKQLLPPIGRNILLKINIIIHFFMELIKLQLMIYIIV